MLDIQVKIEGEKIILEGLENFAEAMPKAVERGLTRAAKGITREAFNWLSGPGRKPVRLRDKITGVNEETGKLTKKKKTRLRGQSDMLGARPGSYPVPIITGHLRRSLNWLKPGEAKSYPETGTFLAMLEPPQAVIYDSASYAETIHEGKGSSRKFGRRPFLTDAFERFNQGSKVAQMIEEEVKKEIDKFKG